MPEDKFNGKASIMRVFVIKSFPFQQKKREDEIKCEKIESSLKTT